MDEVNQYEAGARAIKADRLLAVLDQVSGDGQLTRQTILDLPESAWAIAAKLAQVNRPSDATRLLVAALAQDRIDNPPSIFTDSA